MLYNTFITIIAINYFQYKKLICLNFFVDLSVCVQW